MRSCFAGLRISEPAAVIPPHTINIVVFKCVYCAVQTECLNIIKLIFVFKGRAMDPAVVSQPLIVEAWVQSQLSPPGICRRQVFLRVLQFFLVSIIPPVLQSHLHLHVALNTRTNGRSQRTFQNAVLFWKSGSAE